MVISDTTCPYIPPVESACTTAGVAYASTTAGVASATTTSSVTSAITTPVPLTSQWWLNTDRRCGTRRLASTIQNTELNIWVSNHNWLMHMHKTNIHFYA